MIFFILIPSIGWSILTINVTYVRNTCMGTCSGLINTSTTGGTGGYQYKWTNGSVYSSAYYLCAGTYTCTVTDGSSATATCVATIGVDSLVINETHSNLSTCGVCDGSIYTTVLGKHPVNFWFQGMTDDCFNGSSDSVISNLCAGTYTVQVNNSICSAVKTITITTPFSNLSIKVLEMPPPDCGLNSGIAAVTSITNGIPSFTYKWSNNQTDSLIDSLAAGSYTVTIMDAQCGVAQKRVDVTLAPIIKTTVKGSCVGFSSGQASVFVTGGNGPYVFYWAPSGQSGPTIYGVGAGTYTVSVIDQCGRSTTGSTVVVQDTCSNYIRGNIYKDSISNCYMDLNEKRLKYFIISASKPSGTSYYGYSDSTGSYFVNLDTGSYTVKARPPYPYANTICPVSKKYNVYMNNPNDSVWGVDFGMDVKAVNDLGVHITNIGTMPGSINTYAFKYCNMGSTTQDVIVTFTHDSLLKFIDATPAETSYLYPVITWNFQDVKPGDCKIVKFNYWLPAIDSGGYLGRILQSCAQITPILNDSFPSNNTECLSYPIVGSYDPNYKEVFPVGLGLTGDIVREDSILTYTIHFQNTGTDTAIKIIIRDTLSQFLQVESVVPGAASHPYVFDISGRGVLKWTFNNIMLPDSNTNEPASNGALTYTIHLKKSLIAGTQIKNKAEIYFDFNPPIVTNTTLNTIVDRLSAVKTYSYDSGFVTAYPNPFNEQVTFIIDRVNDNEKYVLEVYDILGKQVKVITGITSKQFTMSKENLQPGAYIYKIFANNKLVNAGKLLLQE